MNRHFVTYFNVLLQKGLYEEAFALATDAARHNTYQQDRLYLFKQLLDQLVDLRARLRQQMAASPVCDTVGFTRDLERAYEQAWRENLD